MAIDPKFGQMRHLFGQTTTHFCLTNCVTRTEQVSIYLRYVSGGVTKETFIGYYSNLRPSKISIAIVHCYFFSLAGPRDKQVVFAIRASRFDPPPMDVGRYAYGGSLTHLIIILSLSRFLQHVL